MKDKVLGILNKARERYVSGEDISEKLGISRTAVWKHINVLRDEGYEIESLPRRGYRLVSVPDFLYPREIKKGLETQAFGRKIYYFQEVDSTNRAARELAENGAEEGTVVIAEQQTRGRGRFGRPWISPYGGIWMSVVLRPGIQPYRVGIITLLAAVCAAQAVYNVTSLQLKIKWPNDLMHGDKKVCGVLTEMKAEMDRTDYIVQGIGLNANLGLFALDELSAEASSLELILGEKVERSVLVQELINRLEKLYYLFLHQGPEAVIRLWEENNCTLGRFVTVSYNGEKFSGTASGVTPEGALILKDASGAERIFYSGEVTTDVP